MVCMISSTSETSWTYSTLNKRSDSTSHTTMEWMSAGGSKNRRPINTCHKQAGMEFNWKDAKLIAKVKENSRELPTRKQVT